MFLNNEFVIGHELVEKMDIALANISQYIKYLHTIEVYSDMKKKGDCVYLKKDSVYLNGNFKRCIKENEFIDVSGLLPFNYIRKELNLNNKELNSFISECKDFVQYEQYFGKKFVRFKGDFVELFDKYTYYPMLQEEANELEKDEFDIIYDLTDKRCVVFYKV